MTATVIQRRSRLLLALASAGVLAVTALAPAAPRAASPPPAPAGLTAIALDREAALAWRPAEGATSYALYRGATAATTDELVTPDGFTGTRFTDTSAEAGETYFYAVRALNGDGASPAGQVAAVTPRAAACAEGGAIAVENCFPGTTSWKTPSGARTFDGGSDPFLSSSSVQAGEAVDLRVMVPWEAPYRVEIYRTGHYGGDQGRLVSTIPGLVGQYPPGCFDQPTTTGIVDCSTWPVAATITTTPDWVSGVYLLKVVREDTGLASQTMLVVRDDGSRSDILYHVSTATYAAYNRFGGKSLYTGLSNAPATLSGTNRAVKVSLDRPYAQATSTSSAHDWYTRTDIAAVSWLEQQGYDVSYIASEDLHAAGGQAADHRVLVSGPHDEYWSQQMFDAARSARDSGTSLVFLGANAVYWKVRFEPSPVTGRPNRVVAGYKTIESGPADPAGSTTTWRDPAGPNRPENELLGQMYVGENLHQNFPMRVSAQEGRHRFWRYTPLAGLAPGTSSAFGSELVGWEWDARAENGREPPGVTTLASSPVTGQIIQGNGAFQSPGSATATATLYEAPSGALVFATGTNNWWRGLARNVHGEGEPNQRLAQATLNVLADMDVRPATPAAGLTVDPAGPPAVTGTSPAAGAGDVVPTSTLTLMLDRELDPATVDDGDVTLTAFDGTPVAGSVALDNAARTLTFRPADALEPFTSYTARVGTGVRSWRGDPSAAHAWTFSTGPGTPPVVVARTPAPGASAVPTDAAVTARFDRRLDATTVTGASFGVRPAAGGAAVAATVTYDPAARTARLTPAARLAPSTAYTAELTTAIRAADGTAMAAGQSWGFTTGVNLQVTGRAPAASASGVSPAANVRATFSRPADPATLTGSTVRLTGPGGAAVAGSVTYDGASRTVTLTPSEPLALSTTYAVAIAGDVHAADGAPLDAVTWTFTTAATAPPHPSATGLAPAAEAEEVFNGTTVRASFDQPLEPDTVTARHFVLVPDDGPPVAATVRYDAATRRAILRPETPLQVATRYTATLTTGIRATTGAPLAGEVSWSFETANCPCSLMDGLTPATIGLPVQDHRPGPGPFSYELGTRITVQEPVELIALRYYKSPGETGMHVGRVWSASGNELASTWFFAETGSGWQRQALSSPVTLQPGQTYTVSVGLNSVYAKTEGGLAAARTSGPLTAPGGANGVYNGSAGSFPTSSWQSSNYFVDAVVRTPQSTPRVPGVATVSPLSGATGVARTARVTAGFTVPLDSSTVNANTFTLRSAAGDLVPADVVYDAEDDSATLTPRAPLETGETYTARLSSMIRSDDETPMAAPVQWSFTTVPPSPPAVTQTSPAGGGSLVSPLTPVRATFSEPIDAETLDAGFTLTGPGGTPVASAVSYDAVTRTATLQPTAALSPSTAYTARLGTGVRSARGTALDAPVTWAFTTSACPCKLFGDGLTPTDNALDTRNWRSGAGPFSLELGVKVRATQPARIEAVRFFKQAGETGTHVGRVWSADGTLLASVTFAGETASGWQQQSLGAPVALSPGQTYVVSVGMNARFGMTGGALASELASGPLRSVADGRNGVYGDAAGTFPTRYWGNSNYFVDTVIR